MRHWIGRTGIARFIILLDDGDPVGEAGTTFGATTYPMWAAALPSGCTPAAKVFNA